MISEGIEIEQSGQVIIARINVPELTHVQMQEVVDECLEHVRMHNGVNVLFVLKGVEFLSSACLGPMVALLQELEHVRGRIAIAECQDNVAFMFKVTRLDAVFTLFDDENEAKAAF